MSGWSISLDRLILIPRAYLVYREGRIFDPDIECGYIYCITNRHTGEKYIGQTKCYKMINGISTKRDPIDRYKQHLSRAFNEKTKMECQTFYTAVRKYATSSLTALEVFLFTVVEKCPLEELNRRERYYIRAWGTKKRGYNISRGGKKKPQAYKRFKKSRGS